MDQLKDTLQNKQYRELLVAAFAAKEHGNDLPSDQLLYVLDLLTSAQYSNPEQRLAAWLKNAL